MSGLLWGSPLALVGVAAVAVPILVHLLATFRARRVPFPTLRFLPSSTPTAMRARRIEDRRLLLLRCLVIIVAAAALAQPWLELGSRGAGGEDDRARAVVIDVSDSVGRPTSSGESGLQVARATARTMVDGASPATTIEAADLAAGIAAARVWLAEAGQDRAGAAEVVVISDFQLGSLAPADLATLPEETGVRLVKLDVEGSVDSASEIDLPVLYRGGRGIAPALLPAGAGWASRWREVSEGPSLDEEPGTEWLAGDDELAGARAAAAAATRVVAVPPAVPPHPVTVVWPGAPERAALQAAAVPPDEPWMADVLAALPDDAGVTAASHDSRLLLFAAHAPGDMASARLMASLRGTVATPMAVLVELEPGVIDDAVLRGWERAAEAEPLPTGSDGRWMWLVVLVLLLLEQWKRRRPAAAGAGDLGGAGDAGHAGHLDGAGDAGHAGELGAAGDTGSADVVGGAAKAGVATESGAPSASIAGGSDVI